MCWAQTIIWYSCSFNNYSLSSNKKEDFRVFHFAYKTMPMGMLSVLGWFHYVTNSFLDDSGFDVISTTLDDIMV